VTELPEQIVVAEAATATEGVSDVVMVAVTGVLALEHEVTG